jgi:oligopeptide/dipeptide ABC transporter ATP-binding protein
MYAGKVVEEGPAVAIFDCAGHPYTQGLLKSLPKPRRSLLGKKAPLYEMSGIVPSLFNLPTGCAFHPRCSSAKEICRQQEPPRFETEPGHFARCWLFE